VPLKRISELHLTVSLNCTSNSTFMLQEQNAVCNVPIPTFTARNQIAVAAMPGSLIPQKVFMFSLKRMHFCSVTVLLLCYLSRLYVTCGCYFKCFRFLHGSMKTKVRVLLAILLMYKSNQILLEMVLV
jgi:hypothetical protein